MNYYKKLITFNNDVLLSINAFLIFFRTFESMQAAAQHMATHTDNGGTFLFFIIEILNSKLNISIEKRIYGVNDGMEVTVIKVEHFSFWREFYQ